MLVMEKALGGEAHHHAVPVRDFDDKIVPRASPWLRDIADTRAPRALDVVREREEGIGRERYPAYSRKERLPLLLRKWLGLLRKIIPPACDNINLRVIREVLLYHIIPIVTGKAGSERKREDTAALAKMPEVRLAACQPRAVYPRLLPGPDSYRLSMLGVAHGVRLGVFQGDKGHLEIEESGLGKVLLLRDYA